MRLVVDQGEDNREGRDEQIEKRDWQNFYREVEKR